MMRAAASARPTHKVTHASFSSREYSSQLCVSLAQAKKVARAYERMRERGDTVTIVEVAGV
jgi:hypothetical protein